jgi:hypothetical protein
MTTKRGSMRSRRVIHAHYGPPENELPVVLATPDVIWRGEEIVLAVPSLLVYTTGVELLIMCRAGQSQLRTIEHVRATAERLRDLKANGGQVGLLGGEYYDHGFTYRAWFTFAANGRDFIPAGDLTFVLEWPEVERAEHRVPGVRDAAGRAVLLW